jgi:hypothetical protein
MQRFFFDVSDGTTVPDLEGEKCQSIEEARDYALEIAKRLATKKPELSNRELFIVVSDGNGQELFRAPVVVFQS